MLCKKVLIQNKLGLHARAAMKLFELAQSFDAKILVSNEEKQVDAESIMGLLLLESAQGQHLEICATGEQAQEALDAVITLVEKKFDEDE